MMIKIDAAEDSIAVGASGAIAIEISEPLDVTSYISDVAFNNDESGKSISVSPPTVRDIPLQATTKQEIQDWIAQKREGSRSGIAITVIVFFGVFLLIELIFVGLGTFYPPANLDLIKDTLPLLSNSLISIVTIVLVFYFKEK
jgi:hypothetical protein